MWIYSKTAQNGSRTLFHAEQPVSITVEQDVSWWTLTRTYKVDRGLGHIVVMGRYEQKEEAREAQAYTAQLLKAWDMEAQGPPKKDNTQE
jgi:hypothetical protein